MDHSSTNTPRRRRTPFSTIKTPSNTPAANDRFIPPRANVDTDLQHMQQSAKLKDTSQSTSASVAGESEDRFNNQLADQLFDGTANGSGNGERPTNGRIISFRTKAPAPPADYQNSLRVLYTQNRYSLPVPGVQAPSSRRHRFVSSSAERVLDAPDLLDDYYVNLLEWSSTDVLAVGLGQSLYLWDAKTGQIDLLMETSEHANHITSVSWMSSGTHLAIGTTTKEVQLWDVAQKKKVRSMRGHQGRVSTLAWNKHILSSGSRDTDVFNHDVRVSEHHIGTYSGHTLEVCGLQWSPDGQSLASGGNDNMVHIWDLATSTPRHVFTDHTAAVKAIAWSPHARNLLATGGGTSDRKIRFWNTNSGACLNSIDTNSQVCGLVWNPHEPEILSAHGFSKYQLTLWKYPSLSRVTDLSGHSSRVLHMTLSSDGTTVCSAAADETLRFWKVFEPVSKSSSNSKLNRGQQDKLARKLTGLNIR